RPKLLFCVLLRTEVAARGQKAEMLSIGVVLFEEIIGQIEDFLELAVPREQAGCFVEHRDPVSHVLEGNAEFGLALTDFVQQRAFSIAITAWAAKFCNSAICLSVNARTSWRKTRKAPTSSPSLSIGTPRLVRTLRIIGITANTSAYEGSEEMSAMWTAS